MEVGMEITMTTTTTTAVATATADIKSARSLLAKHVTTIRRKLTTRKGAALAVGRILVTIIDTDLVFDATPIDDRDTDRVRAIARWRRETFGDDFSKTDYSRMLKHARMVDGLETNGKEPESFYRSVPMDSIAESIDAIRKAEVAPETASDVRSILKSAGVLETKERPTVDVANDSAQWSEAYNVLVTLVKEGYAPNKTQVKALESLLKAINQR